MNIKNLLKIFADKDCRRIYVKNLSANDNSKNQVYLGGSFDILNILPFKEITSHDPGDWKRARFKAHINFSWVNNEGELNVAPEAQLILYPKYPEVRFSGFLKGSRNAPSELMANRIEHRLLFLGVTDNENIIGYVASPESEISKEFDALKNLNTVGVFKELTISGDVLQIDSKRQLINELKRIHELGWIDAKRFNSKREILPCISTNCGGYTLEAELDITPNGYSEPDYLGWEVKQFSVKDFNKFNSSIITLMTPEPTHGYYVESGVEAFIRKYGYADKKGREARINFGGIYKYDKIQPTTNLTLIINGYDSESQKITNTDGFLGLIDSKNNIAASWSFVSLLKHWNRKHANACYVPSLNRKDEILFPFSKQQYYFGNNIMFGSSTDFSIFLAQVANGTVYYDPGIKLELSIEGSRSQNIKRRSQFRVKSGNLISLYKNNEVIDLNKI